MARFLALDWDNREFHLVAAKVHRGKVHVESALAWHLDEPFIPANAEKFGEDLRQRLKAARIAPAPLLIGLGRDRVVVKEVRYPPVGPDVEADIVRNQIVKELTESQDDVLLDYAPLTEPGHAGERRALSLVVKKDIVQALQTISRVAGIKLAAVTARPFGLAACYKYLAGTTPHVPAPPKEDSVVAMLAVTGSWAEFSAVRGRQLLFARSMTVGDGLFGEIRRNLAAYAGQPQLSFPRDAINAVYVCGNGENAVLREKLQETLGIPVYGLDPFVREERINIDSTNRAGFTGAVGLLHLWATDQATPVNFVKPRETKPLTTPMWKYGLVGAIALVAEIIVLVVGGMYVNSLSADELAELRGRKSAYDKQLSGMQLDFKYLDALREYYDGSIPWLEEFVDVAARVPEEKDSNHRIAKGLKVHRIKIAPLNEKAAKGTVPEPTFISGPVEKGKNKAVTLGSGQKITPRMLLTINKDEPDQEIIVVESISGSKITATFQQDHKARASVEKTNFTARMHIEGQVQEDKQHLVHQWMQEINKDKHCRCINTSLKKEGGGMVGFVLQVDLAHQLPSLYTAKLQVPSVKGDAAAQKAAEQPANPDEGGDPDGGGN